ncbi:MAG: hypothetical protein SFU83_18325 [Meiothermus sp.]|nr:hypothetical protein [Meiothermus sp.]
MGSLEVEVRLIPLPAAAEALGLSARYLRGLADAGRLPTIQLSPRGKRFVRLADLEALAARLGVRLEPATLAQAF